MTSLEQEIRDILAGSGTRFRSDCESHAELDFSLLDENGGTLVAFDAKEKQRRIVLDHWPATGIPEPYLFILDDLAARKVLAHAPNSGLIVRNNLHSRYFFISVVDLFLMPRTRANRPIHRSAPALKGKWLIDLRNGVECARLFDAFVAMKRYLDQHEDIFARTLSCYGDYHGETVHSGGEERRPEHWEQDVSSTR
ncbi:MAG: hypothetical protein AB1846_09085 [Chloroflexota bacterium]